MSELWLCRFASRPHSRLRLICFAHAGGSTALFRGWADALPDVDVCAVQLPGRAARHREQPITSVGAIVEALMPALQPELDRPYALFGHSMGAVLALEVARAAAAAGVEGPAHVFLSARRPPHLPRPEADIHRLPDDAFLKVLDARYGGVPAEVLREPELLALFLPTLRADMTALETFGAPEAEPLTCALTVFGGDEDRLVSLDQLRAWRAYTTGAFRVKQFRGGHFYLNDLRAELVSEVSQALAPMMAAARIAS